MDVFLQALNVTVYGLGIVFLTLLVLMFAIMVLSKVFSIATGKEILVAPGVRTVEPVEERVADVLSAPQSLEAPPAPRAEPLQEAQPASARDVSAPPSVLRKITAPLPGKVLSVSVNSGDTVRKGDEVCVIEAMKMGNSIKSDFEGTVQEILVAPGQTIAFGAPLVVIGSAAPASAATAPRAAAAPAAAAPAAAATAATQAAPSQLAAFKMEIGGKQYRVDLKDVSDREATVVVDGTGFPVRRDQPNRVVVDGKPHTVEVKEISESGATVVIDGEPRRVALSPVGPPANYSLTSGETAYDVELSDPVSGHSTVTVGGTSYQVKLDRGNRVIVNGKPHFVDVKDASGDEVTVTVDGITQTIRVARKTAPAPAPADVPPSAPVPIASTPPPPPRPEPAPAPVTAAATPAPARPAAAPRAAAGEAITAPLPGKVLSVPIKAGDAVRKGDELCVIEAMKMGNSIKAQRDGTVRDVMIAPGQTVPYGATLLVLD